MPQSVLVRQTSRVEKRRYVSAISDVNSLTSVTQFQNSFINLYSFPIESKPRIAKIQIYETVKITKTCYFHCLHVSHWEISIVHRKAYKKAIVITRMTLCHNKTGYNVILY